MNGYKQRHYRVLTSPEYHSRVDYHGLLSFTFCECDFLPQYAESNRWKIQSIGSNHETKKEYSAVYKKNVKALFIRKRLHQKKKKSTNSRNSNDKKQNHINRRCHLHDNGLSTRKKLIDYYFTSSSSEMEDNEEESEFLWQQNGLSSCCYEVRDVNVIMSEEQVTFISLQWSTAFLTIGDDWFI